jgi:two-component system cell cycle response regulator DivK
MPRGSAYETAEGDQRQEDDGVIMITVSYACTAYSSLSAEPAGRGWMRSFVSHAAVVRSINTLTDRPHRRYHGGIVREPMAKILVVEDDALIRDIVSRHLRRESYQVVSAVNGVQAITLAQSECPDLILMDIGLPLLNGIQVAERLKARPDTWNIPIIALTAFAMAEDRAKCLAAGCDDYETKPIPFERLLTKIQTLLNRTTDNERERG